jgi:porphobilinogen deaminase
LDDPPTHQAVRAERSLLRGLGGGCLVPIGAATEIMGETLQLRGAVFAPDGKQCVEGSHGGPLARAEEVGGQLAQDLLARGAGNLLDAMGHVVSGSISPGVTAPGQGQGPAS